MGAHAASAGSEALTRDVLDPWGLDLLQARRGFRFGLDAILLAAFVELRPGDTAVELGAGSAVVSLVLARRFPAARLILGTEIEARTAELAARNARQCANVRVVRCDYRTLALTRRADVVFGNPPHHPLPGRQAPRDTARAIATCEITATLSGTVEACARLLAPHGTAYLLYPAAREPELRAKLDAAGLRTARIQRVVAVDGRAPGTVIVAASRHATAVREETLTVLDASGRYTDAAARAYGFPAAAEMAFGGWRAAGSPC
ncbi:MAG: methyltransferase [Acidobacteriota bacterium]